MKWLMSKCKVFLFESTCFAESRSSLIHTNTTDYSSQAKPKVHAMFQVEILLADDNLAASPDVNEFLDRVGNLLQEYLGAITGLDRLLQDVCCYSDVQSFLITSISTGGL